MRDDCIAYYYPSSEVSAPITNNDNNCTLIYHIALYCIVMPSVSALFNTLYTYRTTVHCSVHIVLCCTVLYSVVCSFCSKCVSASVVLCNTSIFLSFLCRSVINRSSHSVHSLVVNGVGLGFTA